MSASPSEKPALPADLQLEARVVENEKEAAAEAAALLVEPGMRVGLGTGTTVAYLIPALAARQGTVDVRFAASSPRTARAAAEAGLNVCSLEELGGVLDLAIDGADQVATNGWLIKGGGGAHTREKVLAAAARRFVVIVSANKIKERLAPPVPLEVTPFALAYVRQAVAPVTVREAPPTPDGNLLCDYRGEIGDPAVLAARLAATPGLVEHGLFPPSLVSEVLIGAPAGVERRSGGR